MTSCARAHLKLGLFGSNVSSGRSYNTAPERWDPSWANNVALAQMADDAGLECMVPIARWKGYGGESNPNGESWESITWAAGLLAATKRINVFATVHVPLLHPIVAAKQMATVDHIGQGRFGVNVVCGWNDDEFAMFGMSKLEHEDRYVQGREWWRIVTGVWRGGEAFDFDGVHYKLQGAEGLPLPWGGQAPLMMNAGTSPSGRQFAIDLSDMHFDAVRTPDEDVARVAETKRLAQQRAAVRCRSGRRSASSAGRRSARPRSSPPTSSSTPTWAPSATLPTCTAATPRTWSITSAPSRSAARARSSAACWRGATIAPSATPTA